MDRLNNVGHYLDLWNGLKESMWCKDCKHGAIHFVLSIDRIWRRAECADCGRLTRRICSIEVAEVV